MDVGLHLLERLCGVVFVLCFHIFENKIHDWLKAPEAVIMLGYSRLRK